MNSVKKWLIANKKDDKDIENLDEIAASRVKYTLPGTVYISGQWALGKYLLQGVGQAIKDLRLF